MKYLVLIGLPGSGKTTLSNLLIKNKIVKGYLSIGSNRNLICRWTPKKLNDKIKEDLAWELFRSSIYWKRFFCDSDDVYVIHLCGVNKKEEKVLEVLRYEDCKYIKLDCDKKELVKRVGKRKENQGWFPYKVSFKEIIKYGFGNHIRHLKSDLILHTDKLNIKKCYQNLSKYISIW